MAIYSDILLECLDCLVTESMGLRVTVSSEEQVNVELLVEPLEELGGKLGTTV